jgi:hypothetical protein
MRMSISPTAEGFRAAFRRPSLTLAEISWRWTAGATAAALFLFGLVEYLDTLPVTNGELLLLHTRQPYLVGEAIAHILRGSLGRITIAGVLTALLLSAVWIVAASLGRLATVQALLDYFRKDVACRLAAARTGNEVVERQVEPESAISSTKNARASLGTLARLNFLRVATALAAVLGLVGAAILASFASPATHPRPAVTFFIFLPLGLLVCLVGWVLNWFLSVAAIFVVRDGDDALEAIAAAVTLCRERLGPVIAVSTWTGLAHLVALVGASSVIGVPLGFVVVLPWRAVVAAMLLLSLAYLALADWLYMARLAGYVCILETPEELFLTEPPVAPLQTTIDRNEPILSDLPNFIVET